MPMLPSLVDSRAGVAIEKLDGQQVRRWSRNGKDAPEEPCVHDGTGPDWGPILTVGSLRASWPWWHAERVVAEVRAATLRASRGRYPRLPQTRAPAGPDGQNIFTVGTYDPASSGQSILLVRKTLHSQNLCRREGLAAVNGGAGSPRQGPASAHRDRCERILPILE